MQAALVPFGGYYNTPDNNFWQQIPRPDGDGYMVYGLMGRGVAPRAGLAVDPPQAQVPAPTRTPDNTFADTPWFDPYGMRYWLTSAGRPAGLLSQPQAPYGLLSR